MKFHYDVHMKKRSLFLLRAERRITQDRLVRIIARHLPKGRTMSQARYSQIENCVGKHPDDDEQRAVAAALDVTVSDVKWADVEAKAS